MFCFWRGKSHIWKDNYIVHRAEWSHHMEGIMYFALMSFFRAKSKFASVMPRDFWEGWNHIARQFATHQEKSSWTMRTLTSLKRTKRICLHRKCNKTTFIFVSMQDSFFPHNYSLKSTQSSTHLLRRRKGKDLIIE